MDANIWHRDLTARIIKSFYNVYDELGGGFLESVYEKSLMVEFNEMGLYAENQKILNVYYKNELVGDFRADIVVEKKVLIEVKAVTHLIPVHEAQLLNYLKVTGMKIGLLVNFGDKLDFKRKIF
ncbi:MAG: GxxExxY protein [Acidobacteria bacterium]|jgi:GxxExxY protein|nr:GxxExxY protein [Acidobacteriota bacterium]